MQSLVRQVEVIAEDHLPFMGRECYSDDDDPGRSDHC